jgi:hypothetical protein
MYSAGTPASGSIKWQNLLVQHCAGKITSVYPDTAAAQIHTTFVQVQWYPRKLFSRASAQFGLKDSCVVQTRYIWHEHTVSDLTILLLPQVGGKLLSQNTANFTLEEAGFECKWAMMKKSRIEMLSSRRQSLHDGMRWSPT